MNASSGVAIFISSYRYDLTRLILVIFSYRTLSLQCKHPLRRGSPVQVQTIIDGEMLS